MGQGIGNRLQTGGSAGHPVGISLSERFRALVSAEDQKAVVDKMVAAAKDGDTKAAEVVLERVFPKPRPLAEVYRIPGMREAKDLVSKAEAVVLAVADGSIPAEYGRVALAALADAARILEVSELAQRIADLEAQLHGKSKPRERVIDGSDLA